MMQRSRPNGHAGGLRGDVRLPAAATVGYCLVSYDELPAWSRLYGSRFIPTGYRAPGCDTCDCVRSVGRVHNETANIWTHLFPSAVYVCLFLIRFLGRPGGANADGANADGAGGAAVSHHSIECMLFLTCGAGFGE